MAGREFEPPCPVPFAHLPGGLQQGAACRGLKSGILIQQGHETRCGRPARLRNLDIEAETLAFFKLGEPRLHHGAHMNEDFRLPIIARDETPSAVVADVFYGARRHPAIIAADDDNATLRRLATAFGTLPNTLTGGNTHADRL